MSEKTPQRRGRKPKPKTKARDVQGSKLLAQIMGLLAPLHDHCPDPKRKLHYDELCGWLLDSGSDLIIKLSVRHGTEHKRAMIKD